MCQLLVRFEQSFCACIVFCVFYDFSKGFHGENRLKEEGRDTARVSHDSLNRESHET
jgi:hypothetical protein